jgi:hypothetical protein
MNLTLYAGNIYKTIFRVLRHMEVWRPTRGKNCHQRTSLSLNVSLDNFLSVYSIIVILIC